MPYVLRGTVQVDGLPEGGMTVRALQHSDGSFVAETETDSTGAFAFEDVENVAHDLYAFSDAQPGLGDGDSPYAKNLHIGVMPVLEAPANAHRYWRVRSFVDSGSSDGVQFSEIRPHLNGVDLTATASRTGTAPSATTPGGGTIAYATDNDVNTEIYWSAGVTAGAFIQFDFGSGNDIEINQFQMGARSNVPTYWPSQFALEHSDDGVSWTPYATVTTPSFPGANSMTSVFAI